jgi:hypothetical protein
MPLRQALAPETENCDSSRQLLLEDSGHWPKPPTAHSPPPLQDGLIEWNTFFLIARRQFPRHYRLFNILYWVGGTAGP